MDHVLDMWAAEAPYVNRRVVESVDAVQKSIGFMDVRLIPAPQGPRTALAGPARSTAARVRRRRPAEMLVGGHVRCDCERHGTLIENRSTVSDAQYEHGYNSSL